MGPSLPAVHSFRRVLLWHAWGCVGGAVGLGLGFLVASLSERAPASEAIAGPLSMVVAGFIALIVLTPVAIVPLGLWAVIARYVAVLERGSLLRRFAIMAVASCFLVLPVTVGITSLLGMRPTGETRPAVVLAFEMIRRDWPYLLIFLPATIGWFAGPRIVVLSLRDPIVPSQSALSDAVGT